MTLGPEWKYHITIENDEWWVIEKWCEENLGKFNEAYYKLGIDPLSKLMNGVVKSTWFFKREEDALLFRLRWV